MSIRRSPCPILLRGCPKTQVFRKFSDLLRIKSYKKASKKMFSDSLLNPKITRTGYPELCEVSLSFSTPTDQNVTVTAG
jgi:hypothetical protein